MRRRRKQRLDGGVRLNRPHFQIRVLRVPASDGGVMLRRHRQCVDPRRKRSVPVDVILEQHLIHDVNPGIDERRLPEPRDLVRLHRAREVLQSVDLRRRLRRSKRRRRRQPRLAA